MLQQANRQISQAGVLSAEEPTSKITSSLAALDDVQALRKREWRRGEPSEDISRQSSTVCRYLTPTQPRHEDMRMDSTLNVTPEWSLKVPERGSDEKRIQQVDPPRRILRTREANQKDALALARHFYATVNGQNQVIMLELPEEAPTLTTGRTTLTPTPVVTSTIPTTAPHQLLGLRLENSIS